MHRSSALLPALVLLASPLRSFAAPQWIEDSNRYTQMLVDVHLSHSPEYGSSQGLSKYDTEISKPTLADKLAEKAERDAVIEKIKAQLPAEKDRKVAEDMQILIHAIDLDDRELALDLRLDVPFINASEQVFQGLRILLDDQVAAERRPAAVVRLRKYAGVEPGFVPVTQIYRERVERADGQARHDLSVQGRDGNRARAQLELPRRHRRALQEVSAERLGRAFRQAQDAADRLRRLGAGECAAQGAHGFPPAAGGVCARASSSTGSTFRRPRSPPWRTLPSRNTRREMAAARRADRTRAQATPRAITAP